MAKPNWFQRTFSRRTTLADDEAFENADSKLVIVHTDPIGSTGVQNYRGYYGEEYLQTLRGRHAADLYDKMRRSEGQVKMALSAVKNPIKKANWEVETAEGDSPDLRLHADFMEFILFKDMDKTWSRFLTEALTMVDFGHSVFEVTHKTVFNHPKFGHYNGIRSLGWRSPRTLERFMLDPETGKLKTVVQYAYGDLGRLVEIPAEYCLLFTIDQEGDNYEGVSMLRACYGAWLRKKTFQKLKAIGVEKYAIPTPIARIPDGKQGSRQYAQLIQALQSFTSHESAYQTLPVGWDIEFMKSDFDVNKIKAAIDGEDQEIVKAFVANFLEFGMSSQGGSYAMSFNQSDFFLSGIEHIAQEICDGINTNLIPAMIKMNYGPQEDYPKLVFSGIADRGGKELAESLKYLCDSAAIIPDNKLEDHLRKRYKFPVASTEGQRIPKQAQGGSLPTDVVTDDQGQAVAPTQAAEVSPHAPASPAGQYSENLRFAEVTAKKQITDGKVLLKSVMQSNLKAISDEVISQLMTKVRKLPESKRLDAIKSLKLKGVNAFKAELQGALAKIATQAMNQARKEVPKKKNVRLSESEGNIFFSEFDQLPSEVKEKILAQASLITESQLADLEKAIYFQFTHSVDSTDSESVLESDLEDSVDRFVEGASIEAASGNTTAMIVNGARNAFFFDDDVIDEIQSFTFTNGDPESPICQDLAGTTFAKDDPEAQRYFPPLHHNCKSFIIPNLVGNKAKETEPLKPSDPKLDQYVTLSDGK